MKDANLKAIEELTAINDIINNILKFKDDAPVGNDIKECNYYRGGFNHACDTISGYIERAIAKMESEVML